MDVAQSASRTAAVRVLDVDPDLGVRIPAAEIENARATLLARPFSVEAGTWELRGSVHERGTLGLLVVDGLLALRTALDDRSTLELVGRGDLLQPWVQLGSEASVTPSADWDVLKQASVLLLDRQFGEAAGPWPEVTAALMHRVVIRSRRLCYQLAVNSSPRTDERLLHTLWALADRWGRVTDKGIVLEIPLTHQQLAELVCATRPSVSAALNHLRDRQHIGYGRDRFVLHGDVPERVQALKREVKLRP